MIISSNVYLFKYKPVSFLQLIHLIAMTYNFSLSPIRQHSNIENDFNNKGIIPLFGPIIFALCYIMARKGKTELYILLMLASTSHYYDDQFFSEVLYRSASIFFSYSALSRFSFHS